MRHKFQQVHNKVHDDFLNGHDQPDQTEKPTPYSHY